MGLVIEDCRGSVHVIDGGRGGGGSGFYAIKPPIEDSANAKALIMGISLDFQEIVQPTTTLDDRRILYLFGTAWNEMSVSGLLLLGDSTTRGAQLGRLMDWYSTNRVSQRKKPIAVSLGDGGLDAYVVGLSLGQANPQTNTQSFVIRLVTPEVEA